ncbi:hypothetical protein FA95DRAFT_1662926 [Auriscalpium vulgare]|uniref:Uncharacterized protein n=1 Tax=Auriscalpium vulgare TaxID=40419 RepID=A0ACB8RUE5_9AGAM|nr:hypothetical protein FA95DRAFT_1662926 [Auriscalpium vulgare]
MDNDELQWRMQEDADSEADEQREAEARERAALVAAAIIAVGIEETHRQRVERRSAHRTYLCRPQLLPNPREGTPWQRLYESRSDRAFVTTMGVDVACFEAILAAGFADMWNLTPIPRADVPTTSNPRPERRSLDAAGALGLVLHYLSSTMREVSLQQIFAIIPTTCSRYITFGLSILLKTVRTMSDATIPWPQGDTYEEYTLLIQSRHPLLVGAFGSVDGLNLPCQTSDDLEIENATFNGWLHDHFISSVLAFAATGIIIWCKLNCPGSWHNARIAKPLYTKLLEQTPSGYFLVADTAFPRGTNEIRGRIRAAMKAGQSLPQDKEARDQLLKFDRQLLSYRQTAEWGMRTIQGSFGRLRIPLEIENGARRGDLLEVCVRLHNLRTLRVGINQIRSVYVPIWKTDDQGVWDGFGDMLFSEQRKRDRVSRFHIEVAYN